jgi:AcrR family transcriptional regulator
MTDTVSKTPKVRRSATETREHVLDVAHELFYWTGIRATGVDRVAADAGIAPTALYRLFPSKDALVAAYVQRAERRYREWFETATRADGRSPTDRILALFDALAEQVQPERCRGCPFMLALTEFPDSGVEGHKSAVRLKKWVRSRIRRLVDELDSARPSKRIDAAALADHLTLLFEGVYATAQALGADGPARRARELTARLIR